MISFQNWQAEPNTFLRSSLLERNYASLQEAAYDLEISEPVLTALMFAPMKLLSDRDMAIVAERFGSDPDEWIAKWQVGFEAALLEKQFQAEPYSNEKH